MSHRVYLGLGTNLAASATKADNIDTAIRALQEHIGPLLKCSSYIQTEPWGFSSANAFLNAAALFSTELSPADLLLATQQIERQMGRASKSRNAQYADRIIDIDILFYDDLVISTPSLTIPHPLIPKRQFVLQPLAEIAPEFTHPVLNKTISALLQEL